MVFRADIMRAVGLALALALAVAGAGAASAETVSHRPKYAKGEAHRAAQARDVTVHNATPSWLTLGPDAGSRAGNYAAETFDQASPVQGTFTGYRGQERLIDQYGVPSAPLFRF